jgi:hypothetical protein
MRAYYEPKNPECFRAMATLLPQWILKLPWFLEIRRWLVSPVFFIYTKYYLAMDIVHPKSEKKTPS